MASPCELLIETQDHELAQQLTLLAWQESKRIEHKFSRYQKDNLLYQINHAIGSPVVIDDETYRLLSFAQTCYELSDGMFDLSSGILRQAWLFDGSERIPSTQAVNKLLPLIGWSKVRFDHKTIQMPKGMELDLGGIGKEYAVDCVAKLCQLKAPDTSIVVNFGGDIQVTQPRKNQQDWHIGIESLADEKAAIKILKIKNGGLATSGDARRFLIKDGVRYSHILNPKTGYPIMNAPRSVTVAAPHCIQAGLLATLALLHGQQAEAFLQEQNLQFWCYR
ncbi:FAD:protein FMN transferase [Paraglaciecola hydrolytica]|uniref:FAD:protein FMN transferase n=1 Tax=Paraglaciecola hydrolytica TaxID=1799789 RepID=A0A136A5T7_9ALTE|nr:FAD:protein FMN transferase [Paraglaciecola hydrolytica]KXI30574.1 thiamine biosynthesis protein ApbE [Paraglaciecola hydrolytica]